MTLENNRITADECRRELDQILHYWASRMVDEENGGFNGRINGRDELIPDAEKGVILNTRILWTFSAAYAETANEEYLKLAQRAYSYVDDHFLDREYGGVYWMLDHTGNPIEKKKQTYAQAFAIYGLTEFYRIAKEEKALAQAIELFNLIEKNAFDHLNNGYYEAFSERWEPLEDVRLSPKDMNAQKTMNTHLHVLEAYTNLYRVYKSKIVEKQLRNLIEVMLDFFVADDFHFHLFFDAEWKRLSHEVSYGHDIEGSWLLCEAAEVLGDKRVLKRVELVAIQMVDAALQGMDTDGGLMNEGDSNGVIDSDKHWWPQAEALVGLVNAHQLTGDSRYLHDAARTWAFVQTHILDSTSGEWHWKVSRSGEQDFEEDKAGPWKCPYHNGRAMIEVARRLKS